MKKVLIIQSSFRKNSNSSALASAFERGAIEAGNAVETVSLAGKRMSFCTGCLACQKTQKCVISDDMVELADKVCSSDVLVFATPIYYYEMSGQLKTMLDRMNPLYVRSYQFRKAYLLTTASDSGVETPNRAENGLEGWLECFPECSPVLAGSVFAGGVTEAGEIENHPALQEAYEMGKSV